MAGCGCISPEQLLSLHPELPGAAASSAPARAPRSLLLAQLQHMGLLSFLFFEGRWSEEGESAHFARAVVLTAKALLGGTPLSHGGSPAGAAFQASWQGWKMAPGASPIGEL